jgi:6-phosphogluconolactonase
MGGGATGGNGEGGSAGKAATGMPFVYVSGADTAIAIFSLNVETASLASRGSAPAGANPSYLAVSDDHRFLYAVNEQRMSRVIAFQIAGESGALTEINRADTMGDGAAHLAVHPSGEWVVVPHYNSGQTVVFPVRDDGGIGAVSDTSQGPDDDRCENAHQAVFDATGGHLFVPCLGSNYVLQFRFEAGKLTLNTPPVAAVPGGPRHLVLHPSLPYAYVLSELESKLTRLRYDREQGLLTEPVTISSVESSAGSSAHVVVHPSGKFLYASNRTENSIGLFSIDQEDGSLTPVAFERGMIATPRDFTLDPSGSVLLAANQRTNDLAVFRVAPADGRLTFERSVDTGDRPSFVGVYDLP